MLGLVTYLYCFSDETSNFSSVSQERNYSIYLNHTMLLKAILLHCGIPEDKLSQVCVILYDAVVSTELL